ncbi:MAG: hypothetical protein IT548_10050 [Alphaproteobacteria bacterium]|nr:hypothetical protein [Alphaproteobacteria bacterium]
MAIVSMDLSVLTGYTGYTNMLLQASKASRAAAASGTSTSATKVDITTPWDSSNASGDSNKLVDALRTEKFVNESDSSFDKEGVPDDYKKLFALYKALSTLQTLANKASDKETASGVLTGLDRRFQTGFAEVMKYASGLSLDTLSLITGPKKKNAETDAAVARVNYGFQTRTLVKGDVQAPIAWLSDAANSTEFNITVKAGSTTKNVLVNIAQMDPQLPRNLGNVINFINDKLKAAGVNTRLQRVELPQPEVKDGETAPPKQYALKVNGNGFEQLTFSATGGTPALYLANQGADGAELRKLSVTPTGQQTVFRAEMGGEDEELKVKTTAQDAQGNSYVLGTTDADQGTQFNQAAQDVMLKKYDSAGNLLWTKLLGATDKVDGLALAVDSTGAAVVAGQITGQLTSTPSLGRSDSFVVKIKANGEEAFIRQLGSSLEDGATALAIGDDDAIYVGGNVKGRMAGAAASNGGVDGYIVKYDDDGKRLYTRQFGTAADEKLSGLAIADDGNLVVATNEAGQAVVRKFSAVDATSAEMWSQTLGSLGSAGSIGGLAVDGTSVYVAGATANSSFGSGATLAGAYSGAQDGFVLKLTDGGSSVTQGFVSFLGSGAADRINGIAVENGRVFVAGDTKGQLPGATQTHPDAANAFTAEIDSSGAVQWTRQFGVTGGEGFGRGIAVDLEGASVLDALGLPKGTLSAPMARTITAQTTARAGDWFEVQIGDFTARKITIEAGETMTTLARKINRVLGLEGKASVARSSAGEKVRIEPRDGTTITLKSGTGQFDALQGLGLTPGKIMKPLAPGETPVLADGEIPTYALGLKASYSLASTDAAVTTKSALESAMAEIRKAYRELTMDPETKKLMAENAAKETKGKTGGTVPAYLTAQLSNYSAGLQRLLAGSSSAGTLT